MTADLRSTAREGTPDEAQASPWPRRFALATLLTAIPLLLFGGSVTTMGAGMAVEGWINAEGHFLPFFPIEKWFRDGGTFVEHTHRMAGVFVGLFAIGLVVSTFRTDGRRLARGLALAVLLAIVGQGTLGGFRVLENSPELAFLHGTLAQFVFALLCVAAVVFGRAWSRTARDAESLAERPGRGPERMAGLALFAVAAQVAVGAWYRHGLRPTPEVGIGERLVLHLALAFVVVLAVIALGVMLLAADGNRRGPLRRVAMRLFALLGVQVALGLAAWLTYDSRTIGSGEITTSILHVLGGALLLGQTAAAWLWAARSARDADRTEAAARPAEVTA